MPHCSTILRLSALRLDQSSLRAEAHHLGVSRTIIERVLDAAKEAI